MVTRFKKIFQCVGVEPWLPHACFLGGCLTDSWTRLVSVSTAQIRCAAKPVPIFHQSVSSGGRYECLSLLLTFDRAQSSARRASQNTRHLLAFRIHRCANRETSVSRDRPLSRRGSTVLDRAATNKSKRTGNNKKKSWKTKEKMGG